MGYGAILKRAWAITWKYKILWLFGLLSGSAATASNSSSYRTPTPWTPTVADVNARITEAMAKVQPYWGLVVIGLVVATVFGLLFYLVTAVARGGLIHLVNEAEEGREVRARHGWSAGFAKMWRIFGVDFVTGLPLLVPALLSLGAFWIAAAKFVELVGTESSWQAVGTALVRDAGLPVFGMLSLAGLFGLVFGLIVGVVEPLALRYAVIEDKRVMESIGQGWKDLFAGRGAFVMMLVIALVSIAFGIVMGIAAAVLAGPMIMVAADGGVQIAQPAGPGLALLLVLPAAVFAAFHHAAWTVFFRKMTGHVAQAAPMPAPAPAPTVSDV